MDLSYTPDVFSLAVFIAGFRPLVRRVGSHVNLWFLGWGFMLLHYIALAFASPAPSHRALPIAALFAVRLCALCFLIAAANLPTPHLGPAPVVELAIPILIQLTLSLFAPAHPHWQSAAAALFFLPGLHLLFAPHRRSRSLVFLGTAFALFAAFMVPVATASPTLVADGALALVFLTAAYLYAASAERLTRGVVAAVTGLAAWGLTYPLADAWLHAHPGAPLDRALLECPQYLVVAGIILTLIEQHVHRTERLAMHDPLTDLPNRRLFEERLVATMEEARLNRTTIACLVIDVDNFKAINDTLGHTAGDQLLRALAVRLAWHMSPRDILARTGGDEFTALLAGVHDENHLRFIASAMMSAASVPIAIEGHSVDVRISVGIALSPDHADDIDNLRRLADEAMYTAKRRGGSLLAFAGED